MNSHTTAKKVWDLPIRLIHWLMVIFFAGSWFSAENDEWDIHRYFGYGMLALLVFRVYWGFAGSSTARFSHFLRSPAVTWQYVLTLFKRDQSKTLGHNPLGGLSSLVLISLLFTQVSLGLFAIDVDGWESGPLNHYVSFETGRWCAQWHDILFNILLGFIALHIVAIFYYLTWRNHNLILSMFTGKTKNTDGCEMIPAAKIHYIIATALAVLAVYWLL